jgi:hypothetical protein
MRRKVSFFVCLLIFTICLAHAQQQQFDQWHFRVPAGWQMASQDMLIPAGAPNRLDSIRLYPAQPLNGDLRSWLEAQVQKDTSGIKVLRADEIKPLELSHGSQFVQKVVLISNPVAGRLVRAYVAGSPGQGRAALICVQTEAAKTSQYVSDMTWFLQTVQFSQEAVTTNGRNQTAIAQPGSTQMQAVEPAVHGTGELNGLYTSMHLQVMAGPNFTSTSRSVWDYYRFFPDGWVYMGFPAQGDPASLRCPQAGTGQNQCQRYVIQGNTIRIGASRPQSFEHSLQKLEIGGTQLVQLKPLPPTLSGTWQAKSGSGAGGTAAMSVNSITFASDGTFLTSGGTGVTSSNQIGNARVGSSAYGARGGSGRYRISGYVLELDYSNGQVVREKIVAPGVGLDMLVIGETNYLTTNRRR